MWTMEGEERTKRKEEKRGRGGIAEEGIPSEEIE